MTRRANRRCLSRCSDGSRRHGQLESPTKRSRCGDYPLVKWGSVAGDHLTLFLSMDIGSKRPPTVWETHESGSQVQEVAADWGRFGRTVESSGGREIMKLEVVDQCDVTVLVDNVMDILSTGPDSVTGHIANVVKAGATERSGKCLCCAHWGLSLVITVRRGTSRRTLLFDSGPEGWTLERNANRLGIDFSSIDAAMFSHGHWDHVGGMVTALRLISAATGNRQIPIHVNDGMFVHRGIHLGEGQYMPLQDLPTRSEIEAAGGMVHAIDEPHRLLEDMFYISGEIPRVTPYERGLPKQVKDLGNGWEPDPWIMDERYAAVRIKNKGIVVFTACSHAGVVNVLRDARRTFAPEPLYGIMGGFHLSGNECEAIIPETIEDMKAFNLKMIVPGHCTGWRAVHRLVEAFGESRVIMSGVGQSFSF